VLIAFSKAESRALTKIRFAECFAWQKATLSNYYLYRNCTLNKECFADRLTLSTKGHLTRKHIWAPENIHCRVLWPWHSLKKAALLSAYTDTRQRRCAWGPHKLSFAECLLDSTRQRCYTWGPRKLSLTSVSEIALDKERRFVGCPPTHTLNKVFIIVTCNHHDNFTLSSTY
jgi:hypothetical protein